MPRSLLSSSIFSIFFTPASIRFFKSRQDIDVDDNSYKIEHVSTYFPYFRIIPRLVSLISPTRDKIMRNSPISILSYQIWILPHTIHISKYPNKHGSIAPSTVDNCLKHEDNKNIINTKVVISYRYRLHVYNRPSDRLNNTKYDAYYDTQAIRAISVVFRIDVNKPHQHHNVQDNWKMTIKSQLYHDQSANRSAIHRANFDHTITSHRLTTHFT